MPSCQDCHDGGGAGNTGGLPNASGEAEPGG